MSGETGPWLLVNQKEYHFTDSEWKVEVEILKGENVFRLWVRRELVIEETYSPAPVDDLDPWSDEESEDLFVWLTRKRNDEEFIELWTDK
ncbi:hypothetical protein [Marinimicrobium agarilyticum]|uniref:hypothetical protein n=1 Tax=Marinimicrobium agarilyticum TaxID=306546 RepID=UPI000425AE17|nr:hypothetical protein [Marinimicrobium agarilyticum]